jgi:hypothetical protein
LPERLPTSASVPSSSYVYATFRAAFFLGRSGVVLPGPACAVIAAGWIVNTAEDVAAWTAVEMMKCLVGQSVSYDFVRMAGKKGFF